MKFITTLFGSWLTGAADSTSKNFAYHAPSHQLQLGNFFLLHATRSPQLITSTRFILLDKVEVTSSNTLQI